MTDPHPNTVSDGFERPPALAELLAEGGLQSLTSRGPPLMLRAGDPVGDFEAVRRLGVGGLSEVWAVRHRQSGEERALKVLLRPADGLVRRLIGECLAHISLAHPNVLPVLGCLRHEGQLSLLMPVVRGPSLGQLLTHGTHLSQPQALTLFRGILAGVAHAHEQRIIHRDLKPDNVMIDTSGPVARPLVTDFGIARQLDVLSGTQAGVMMGTPRYCAPEQLGDASTADRRADVFSLGVMMVEMVTGHLPFHYTQLSELGMARDIKPDLGGLDPRLHDLALAMLARDPDDRLPSVATVSAALDALDLEHEDLPSEKLTPARRATQPRSPSRAPQPTFPHTVTLDDGVPLPSSALVGRAEELDQLKALLAGTKSTEAQRLVTIAGPGGIGKTRLALELAHELVEADRSVVWADVEHITTEEGLLRRILSRLSPLPTEERSRAWTLDALFRNLRKLGDCLLILDSADACRRELIALLGPLMKRSKAVRVLVTCRSPTRIRGESVLNLSDLDAERAVELLCLVAAGHGLELQLAKDTQLGAASLVERVGGNPLAIELMATFLRRWDLPELLRLGESELLELEGDPDAELSRHRSLAANLAWSWSLLPLDDQKMLARFSLFRSEFTLEAARHVLGINDLIRLRCRIGAVADAGLLTRRFGPSGQLRLGFPLLGRTYARARLDDTGRSQTFRRRHRQYFARLRAPSPSERALDPGPFTATPIDIPDLLAIADEVQKHGDADAAATVLLTALEMGARSNTDCDIPALVDRIVAQGPPREAGLRLRTAQLQLLESRGDLRTCRSRVTPLLVELSASTLRAQQAQVLLVRARLALWCDGELTQAAEDIDRAASIAATPWTYLGKAEMLLMAGDLQGARWQADRALELASSPGQEVARTSALILLSRLQLEQFDLDGAMAASARSRNLAETLNDLRLLGLSLRQESMCHALAGRLASARRQAERAVELLHAADALLEADRAQRVLVRCLCFQGSHSGAAVLAQMLARDCEERGQTVEHVELLLIQAGQQARMDSPDAAQATLDTAHRLMDAANLQVVLPRWATTQARVQLARGEGDQVVDTVQQWEDMSLGGTPRLRFELRLLRAQGFARLHRLDKALPALEEYLKLTVHRGIGAYEGQVRVIKARVLQQTGLVSSTRKACEEAAEVLERIGAAPLLEEMEQMLQGTNVA